MTERYSDLSAALRRLPAPDASPELLERVLRSRVLGRRFVAPSGEAFPAWRWIAAAAVVTLLIGGSWGVSLFLTKLGESGSARDRLNDLLGDTRLWPSREEPGAPREIPPPAYALITSDALDTSRLTAGDWTYRYEKTVDGVATEPSYQDRIRLTRGTYAGRMAWMVNTSKLFHAEIWNQFVDTTYLDASSLRPLRAFATANKGRTQIEQTFSTDSGREAFDLTAPTKRSYRGAVALSFPANALFLNDWFTSHLAVLVPALPLRRGWRGSLYQVSFSPPGAQVVAPMDLRVVGREQVTVPAGTFDCWRLEVASHLWDFDRYRMWVSRDRGWLIKEQYGVSDYVFNRVLERFQP